jgi:hypothetical protein
MAQAMLGSRSQSCALDHDHVSCVLVSTSRSFLNDQAAVGNGLMTFAAWWRRVLSRKGRSRPISREASEAGITARVDMVRFEALAEAAHEAMYEARLRGAKGCYEEARAHFAGAIEAAQRAGLHEEAARLKRRRDHVARVYNSQFRYS